MESQNKKLAQIEHSNKKKKVEKKMVKLIKRKNVELNLRIMKKIIKDNNDLNGIKIEYGPNFVPSLKK